MRSAIDARGSTIAAGLALLAGIGLIAGSLFRVGQRAPSADVVSRTVPLTVEGHHVERTVAGKTVVRDSHARARVRPVAFPSPNSGVLEGVGTDALDDLALPPPTPASIGAPPAPQSETSGGLATAAADFGDGVARGSQKAGARTAAFFKRFGKKVAASFGR
jgi:hypothetical protein